MSSSSPEYKSTQRFYGSFGRRAGGGAGQGQSAAARAQLGHLPARGAGGVPVGQRPRECAGGRGRAERSVWAARARADCEGGVRPGHVRQRGGQPDRRTARRADQAGRSAGQAGRTGRLCGGAGARPGGRRSPDARRAGEQDHPGALSGVPGDASRSNTGSPRDRASTIPTSSRRSFSIRASRPARRRRASPTCSRAPTRR